MGTGTKTDRLGDGDATSDDAGLANDQRASQEQPILREALKGNMVVENSKAEPGRQDKFASIDGKLDEAEVDKMKGAERKGFGEVY